MRRRLSRALWASLLGLGVMAGLARGQDGPHLPSASPPPGVPQGSPAMIPVSPLSVMPGMGAVMQPPLSGYSPLPAVVAAEDARNSLAPLGTPTGRQRHQVWSQPPTGCWTHHNLWGCGTLRSELRFVFGSCRAFFGSCCEKEPPLLPVTPCPRPYVNSPYNNGTSGSGGAAGCTSCQQ